MTTATIRSYEDKRTLWQSLGGSEIRMIAIATRPELLFQLIVNGFVCTTMSKRYPSYRQAAMAFDAAKKSGTFSA